MLVIQEIQKIVELPQKLIMDEVADMSVVMKGEYVRFRRTRRPGSLPQCRYLDKIFGVPVAMQHQVPTVPVR